MKSLISRKNLQEIIFIELVAISIFIVFLYKINKEKGSCKCTDGWKKNVIEKFTALLVTYYLILSINYDFIPSSIKLAMSFLIYAYLFLIISWITDMRKRKCTCGNNWKKTFIEIYVWIYVLISLIVALF